MPNRGSGAGVECCAPTGCLLADEPHSAPVDSLHDAVKAACSNEHCSLSGLMHRQCFDHWESHVLQFLRSCGGRARQWTERQRQHNLWTKKGYDLAFKVTDRRPIRARRTRHCPVQQLSPLAASAFRR